MRSTTLEQLSAADAEAILKYLPERIRAALIAHAAEIEYPMKLLWKWQLLISSIAKHLVLPIANRGAATKESELEIRES